MPKIKYEKIIPNKRIHHLIPLEQEIKVDKNLSRSRVYWKCHCTRCRKTFVAREDLIKNGQQQSCGCLGKQLRARWLNRNAGKYES